MKLKFIPFAFLLLISSSAIAQDEEDISYNEQTRQYTATVNLTYQVVTGVAGASCAITAWNGNPLALVACPTAYKLLKDPGSFGRFAEASCNFIVQKTRNKDKVDCKVIIWSDSEAQLRKVKQALEETDLN